MCCWVCRTYTIVFDVEIAATRIHSTQRSAARKACNPCRLWQRPAAAAGGLKPSRCASRFSALVALRAVPGLVHPCRCPVATLPATRHLHRTRLGESSMAASLKPHCRSPPAPPPGCVQHPRIPQALIFVVPALGGVSDNVLYA